MVLWGDPPARDLFCDRKAIAADLRALTVTLFLFVGSISFPVEGTGDSMTPERRLTP